MILKNILSKGQIVLPKTIRDLLGINVGDQVIVDVKDDKIILTKKHNVKDLFDEAYKKCNKKITMKEIKMQLNERYERD